MMDCFVKLGILNLTTTIDKFLITQVCDWPWISKGSVDDISPDCFRLLHNIKFAIKMLINGVKSNERVSFVYSAYLVYCSLLYVGSEILESEFIYVH